MNTKGVFSHNTDEWQTPKDLYNELNSLFNFTLDPCANNENHLCDKYYTKEENGLLQSWAGETVFCNPPYSDCASWVKKCFIENYINNITIVLLIPVRTDTKYFHDFIYRKAEINFIKGRLRFSNSKKDAPFPSMIVVYHKKENFDFDFIN